jgi:tetratricopeptide (TPR) repeat protein
MRIFLGKGKIDKAAELAPVCISKFDLGTSRGILGDAVRSEMAAERYDNAGKLLDAVEKHAGSVQALKDMAAVARTDILFMKGDWAAAGSQFVNVAAGLADGDLAGWFPGVIGRCVGKGQLDLADKLCDFVLKNQKDKANSRNQAAMRWIEVAKARKDMAMIPARLEALKVLAMPEQVLFALFQSDYYTVLGDTNKANIVAMLAFGDKLEALLPGAEDKAQMRALALDGSFIVEDYARSLKILEAGIAGRDKNWHEMAINKAKAHLALQAGKYKEAVDSFRKFMDGIEEIWERPEQDPVTGVSSTKEMCLGLNAKRIGDIWAKAGDAKAAADAYAEARGFYKKALVDVKADSKEAEVIKTELGQIPAAQ